MYTEDEWRDINLYRKVCAKITTRYDVTSDSNNTIFQVIISIKHKKTCDRDCILCKEGINLDEWYVFRTISGKEETTSLICKKMFSQCKIINPKRKVYWRKSGNTITTIRPLFEGYLFAATDRKNIEEFDYLLRKHRMGIGWLVYSAGSLLPIFPEEKQLIQKLIGNEGIVEISEVKKVQNQIQIVNGPLLGLEGIVTNYSRRNRRVTVEVPILQEKKQIELGGILVNPNRPG
ncbi:transcriptional antiterminator NusG [Dendrosporobacter quercicolus]|uniref:Transcriptional antiterminator NusG n=1 Tax=Dendrosporobacter quercicolus TaxID=146817 RepID=A0A1G9NDU7_9FIRM|nr:transcriptional antiterminator NusG [Dendrosporobacter quercicolus]